MTDAFHTIFRAIEDEKRKWEAEKTDAVVRNEVREFLDGTLRNTVLKIIGFDYDYDYSRHKPTWKVDHCNNRSGNSIIGEIIRDSVRDIVVEMLGDFRSIPKETLDSIRKDANRYYTEVYRNTARQEARTLAEKHAREFIKSEVDRQLQGDAEKVRMMLKESNGG